MERKLQGSGILHPSHIVLVVGIFLLCVGLSFLLTTHNAVMVTGGIIALGLFAFGFLSPRIALYLLIFSMLLSPEFGARDVSGRGFTIRFEDILLLIMGFVWFAKSRVFKNVGFITKSPLNIAILLYMLACIFSVTAGNIQGTIHSPLTSVFFVLKYFEYFIIFFLTVNNVHSKEQVKKLLWAIFITYIIVLVMGLLQIPRGQRITAPFEGSSSEPNTLGGYLIIMFSLTLALFLNSRGMLRKIGVGILGLMCVVAILFTLSRATWLGFIPMYLTYIVISQKRKILAFALVVFLIILPFFLPQIVIDRLMYTVRGDTSSAVGQTMAKMKELHINLDSSTEARLASMQQVIKDFQKKPILGYGITGYYFLDAQYHRVLIESGLVGLTAFLFLLWKTGSTLFMIRRRYLEDPLYNILTTGTFCAFIGLLFHAIGTNTFIIVRIMEPFWCLVGLCVSIPIIEGEGYRRGPGPGKA
jgi:hypothetical protein